MLVARVWACRRRCRDRDVAEFPHSPFAVGSRRRDREDLCALVIIGISASPTARPYPRNGHAVGDADIERGWPMSKHTPKHMSEHSCGAETWTKRSWPRTRCGCSQVQTRLCTRLSTRSSRICVYGRRFWKVLEGSQRFGKVRERSGTFGKVREGSGRF